MKKNKSFLLLLAIAIVALATFTGCAHKSLNPESLKDVTRPAIVIRALSDPSLSLSDADAGEVQRLSGRLNGFQMGERLRSAMVHHLPNVDPWTDIMPSVEVSTALDTLLVQDKAESPRYELLAPRGCNTILEVLIEESGLHYNPETKKTGFFLTGKARMFHIDGGTLWKAPFSLDSTTIPEFPGLDPKELHHDEYFNALNDFLFRLTAPAMKELAGDLPTAQNYEFSELNQREEAKDLEDGDGDGEE